MVWNSFSHCVLCTVIEDPDTSDFAPGRTARQAQGIPVIIYEGFVVSKRIYHTPKSDAIAIYEGFVVSKRTSLTPRGNTVAICLGFFKLPKQRTYRTAFAGAKKVFDRISFEACDKKGHPSNVSNGLGNSKGTRRETRCSMAGGPEGQQASEICISP